MTLTSSGSFVGLFIALALLGCSATATAPASNAAAEPLLVLAASDLQGALPVIIQQYEASGAGKPILSLGSTGNFAAQIENGAPADIFFAADRAFIDRLERQGLVAAAARKTYAIGRLALVASTNVIVPVQSLQDFNRPEIRTVALANPEHAPYGRAGQQALQSLGLWSQIEPKLVLGENVAQTYQFVQTGNADAGIVALSIALGTPGAAYVLIDESLHQPLVQEAAVLTRSKQPEQARAFLDYVTGPNGRPVLDRFGFGAPGKP